MSKYSDLADDLQVPTGAMDYAEKIGLSQQAREGYGTNFVHGMVRSALRGRNMADTIEKNLASVYGTGMQHSGVADRVIAKISAGMAGQAMDDVNRADQVNEQYKGQARGALLGIQQHQDSMQLQVDQTKANLLAQEPTAADQWLQALTVVGSLMPF